MRKVSTMHRLRFPLTRFFCTLPALAAVATGAVPEHLPHPVAAARMEAVYQELKTPYKWGPVLSGPGGSRVDNPRVFRVGSTWFMTYNHVAGPGGYEGWLARSDNLVNWAPVGKILGKGSGGWDDGSVGAFLGLQGLTLDTVYQVGQFNGRYWLSYLGGRKDGFETYPLNLGLASTTGLTKGEPWTRLPSNPILATDDETAGDWENRVLFASQLVHDTARTLGYEYLLLYNAKGRRDNAERIGLAGSDDLIHWHRRLHEPVMDNYPDYRISGDPQLLKLDDLYVMLYARGVPARAEVGDHETFACSYDLVHWTQWSGTGLTREPEPWEGRTTAHKPWVFRWNGVVYHFFNYTHLIDGKPFGGIGVATSRYIGESFQFENLEIDRASRDYQIVPGMELAGYQGVNFRSREPGDTIRFVFNLPEPGEYDVRLALLAGAVSGAVRISFDGMQLGGDLSASAAASIRREFALGIVKVMRPGPHHLEAAIVNRPAGGGELLLDSMDWLKR